MIGYADFFFFLIKKKEKKRKELISEFKINQWLQAKGGGRRVYWAHEVKTGYKVEWGGGG